MTPDHFQKCPEVQVDEKDLPAKKKKEKTSTRIFSPYADRIRAERDQAQAHKREKGTHSLRTAQAFLFAPDVTDVWLGLWE